MAGQRAGFGERIHRKQTSAESDSHLDTDEALRESVVTREPRYRGPWRLLGPDSHRLAALNLTPGYIRTSFPARMPGLLDVRRIYLAAAEAVRAADLVSSQLTGCVCQPSYPAVPGHRNCQWAKYGSSGMKVGRRRVVVGG